MREELGEILTGGGGGDEGAWEGAGMARLCGTGAFH